MTLSLKATLALVAFPSVISLWGSPIPEEAKISVRAEVLSQTFCLGPDRPIGELIDPNTITLRLRMEFYYRNAGTNAIILPVDPNRTIIVSKTSKDITSRSNQMAIPHGSKKNAGDLKKRGIDLTTPAYPYFQVIQPGEKIQGIGPQVIDLRVHTPPKTRSQTEFLGKDIFLQVELTHLLTPSSLAQELKRRWSDIGVLWVHSERTQPIPLRIPKSPTTSVCPTPYSID